MRQLPDLPSPSQLRVLEQLKELGSTDATELARALHMSTSGVRQHLSSLVASGYVEFRTVRAGAIGRDPGLYSLSAKGEALFPSGDREQLQSLLQHVSTLAPEVAHQWAKEFMHRVFQRVFAPGLPVDFAARLVALEARVNEVRAIAAITTTSPEESVVRVLHCPVLAAATALPVVCDIEMGLIRDQFPEMVVERPEWRLGGDSGCSYRLASRERNATDSQL